jgi:hypothetical protein
VFICSTLMNYKLPKEEEKDVEEKKGQSERRK